MRIACLFAIAAALTAQPAAAAAILFRIVGDVPVTRTTFYGADTSTWPERCAGLAYCAEEVAFDTVYLDWSGVPGATADEILYTFDQFRPGPREGISGTFRFLGNGAYQGETLLYGLSPLPAGVGPWHVAFGQTASFAVYQQLPVPAPEPATWTLLLLGFGAAGAALRGRPAHKRPPARAPAASHGSTGTQP